MDERIMDERRRRVQRLKKMILLLLITSIVIPIVLCIVLFIRMNGMQKQIDELQKLVEFKKSEQMAVLPGEDSQQPETSSRSESVRSIYNASDMQVDEASILQEDGRKIYLTFDDGPSTYTNDILDILKQYDVKATFFVVGKTDEESLAAYQRIVKEGHTLGMHSYSHKYEEIYQSVEAYAQDLSNLQEFLYKTTGVWSRYTRFPGGSSNEVSQVRMKELIQYLDNQGIQYFDWNISSGDAANGQVSVQVLVDNVLNNVEKYGTVIVLMHDAADKATTVEALPIIIEKLQEIPNTRLMAIDDETVPVQHIKITD